MTERKVGILVYVKSSIPSRRLACGSLCDPIQAISFEINLRKEEWLVISVYRPPTQDREYVFNSPTKLIDLCCNKYYNYLIMGDFNMEPTVSALLNFLCSNDLSNLMKENTYFKGTGSCIDLILTNRKYSFKHVQSYETRISSHHHMIYAMLRSSFQNKEPKVLNYRDFRNFPTENFNQNLAAAGNDCGDWYDVFKQRFVSKDLSQS